jgi:AcrR family transcriptional regulator
VSEHPTTSTVTRRQPAQRRSRVRVDRVLEVAEEMIAERGFDSLKISAVATRAKVNIATFYQFFPNRAALIRALIERHVVRVREAVRMASMDLSPKASVEDVAEHLGDAVWRFYQNHPRYLDVWCGLQADKALKRLDIEDTIGHAETFRQAIDGHLSHLPEQVRQTAAQVMTVSTANLFRFAMFRPPAEQQRLRAEHNRLIRCYLGDLRSAVAEAAE